MAKTSIQRIAEAVASKHNCTQKEAEDFVQALFKAINEGLDTDKVVKLKGLGTFKVVGVKPRESVNVNTGERVVISGHDKVSFTPDAAMKDLVNKPFAQFETVVLNDGVDFEAIDAEATHEETTHEEVPHEETTTNEVTPQQEEKLTEAPAEEKSEETVTEKQPVEEIPIEEAPTEEVAHEDTLSQAPAESEEEGASHKRWWLVIGLFLLLAAAAVAGYFYYNHLQESSPTNEPQATAQQPAAKPEQPVAQPEQPADTLTSLLEKANQDPRVRAGAYDIVGIDSVVTLREGQTMESYCRHTLGRDMIVYFQALNGCDQMTGGQQMKVPRVQMRR